MMRLKKSVGLAKLLRKADNDGFAVKKLRDVITLTNTRSGIRAATDAKASIRHKSQPSIAGLPFRNQTGLAKRSTSSHATSNNITLSIATHYGKSLEFGEGRRPPHPILAPALRRQSGYIRTQLERDVGRFYKKYD